MLNQLPILQVIVPLLAAPACLLIDKARLAWVFAVLVSGATLVISALLLWQVYHLGVISYHLGGWLAPWGIEYRIDMLNAYVLLVVSAICALVIFASRAGIRDEIPAAKQPFFYVSCLLAVAGLLGIAATGDVFNAFVFLEISSLASYALIAQGKDRRALWASYQYLLVGTIGATFILIGIGFLYSMTGTLNMQDLAQRLPALANSGTVFTAFTFITVGVCLKLALFPLHFWLPNAYAYAPAIVTALLAATATKVAVYLLIRFYFSVFGPAFSGIIFPVQVIFMALGIAGIVIASLVAACQSDIKRLFAYSSIAQVGYMVAGIAIGTVAGLQASLLHLFNHALMKGALFLAVAAIILRTGSANISAFTGMGRRMPWTMAAIVVGGLSLVGVPLTVGFVSKWYLVLALIDAGLWPLVFFIAGGAMLALWYIWRIVEAAYFQTSEGEGEIGTTREAPLTLLIPTWILVLANIYFGMDTRLTVTISEMAAHYLLEGL